MVITQKAQTFVPAPEGIHPAIVRDVTELKEAVTPKFGKKSVFRIVFEIDQMAPSGHRFTVFSQQLTPSLHEKANCRKVCEKIIGRPFTSAELEKGVDLDALLLNKQCTLVVEHKSNTDGTKVYANIALIQPVKTAFPAWQTDFIRFKDRKEAENDAAAEEAEADLTAPAVTVSTPATTVTTTGLPNGVTAEDLAKYAAILA